MEILKVEEKINGLLEQWDLAAKVGDIKRTHEIMEIITKEMNKLNENEIKITTEKIIH